MLQKTDKSSLNVYLCVINRARIAGSVGSGRLFIHPPHSAARGLHLCLPFERTLGPVLQTSQLDGVDSVINVTIDTSRLREKHTMHIYATATSTLTCTFTISLPGPGGAVASALLVLENLLVRILDCRHDQKYSRTIERNDAPVDNY
jgi:hypothetical protein